MFKCRGKEDVQFGFKKTRGQNYERCHFIEQHAPGRQVIIISKAGEYSLRKLYNINITEAKPARVVTATTKITQRQRPGEEPEIIEHPVATRLNVLQVSEDDDDDGNILVDKLKPATNPRSGSEGAIGDRLRDPEADPQAGEWRGGRSATPEPEVSVIEAARQAQRTAGEVANSRVEGETEPEEPDPTPETKAERKVRKAAARKAKADTANT